MTAYSCQSSRSGICGLPVPYHSREKEPSHPGAIGGYRKKQILILVPMVRLRFPIPSQ